MAKPRIFISSTYYDLKYIRSSMENFIIEMGYEPILFESGDIPFKHDLTLDESCYKEIENAHMQVLIIGGRYGSAKSDEVVKSGVNEEKMYLFFNSITKIEYKTAIEKGIPIYVFVEKQVFAEYETFKNNRENNTIKYAHVDSINIFKLIDEILSQKTGNYIKSFEKFEDISTWLREQWAGLFADYLKNNRTKIEIKALSSKINELGSITGALKEYTEAIMRKIQPEDYEKLIDSEEKKIELEKLLGFENEPMIRYIISEGESKIKPKQVYTLFKSSKSLEEFVNKLNINEVCKNMLLNNSNEYVLRDFKEYKLRYQNIRID